MTLKMFFIRLKSQHVLNNSQTVQHHKHERLSLLKINQINTYQSSLTSLRSLYILRKIWISSISVEDSSVEEISSNGKSKSLYWITQVTQTNIRSWLSELIKDGSSEATQYKLHEAYKRIHICQSVLNVYTYIYTFFFPVSLEILVLLNLARMGLMIFN